jgi:hypothetical protein
MWVIPEDLGNFSPKKEKNLGEQKFPRVSVSNFCGRIVFNVVLFSTPVLDIRGSLKQLFSCIGV